MATAKPAAVPNMAATRGKPHDERGTGYRLICSRNDEEFAARSDTMEATWSEALRFAGRAQREQALAAGCVTRIDWAEGGGYYTPLKDRIVLRTLHRWRIIGRRCKITAIEPLPRALLPREVTHGPDLRDCLFARSACIYRL